MNSPTFYPLSKITARIGQMLQPALGKQFWVKGEIASGREKGGCFYCDLVESNSHGKIIAKIQCTIWSSDLFSIRSKFKTMNIPLKLDNGTQVGVLCSIQYHNHYGLSLKVLDADPSFAFGELELRKRRLIQQLEKEGLFQLNKQIAVPCFTQRIGLVTSKGCAAYTDFITTLTASSFGFCVYLADSSMQGVRVESDVLRGLHHLERLDPDIVVIIRGGGAKTDLYYMDSEKIARRIASYPIPVWTGIGHEIDISVLDYVANRYYKTPTAVAEELVARLTAIERFVDEGQSRLKSYFQFQTKLKHEYINRSKTGIVQGTRKLLDISKSNMHTYVFKLDGKVKTRISREKSKTDFYHERILSVSKAVLQQRREKLAEKHIRMARESVRMIGDAKRAVNQWMIRFTIDRFVNMIHGQRRALKTNKERLYSLSSNRINKFQYIIASVYSRLKPSIIMNRISCERRILRSKEETIRAHDPKHTLKRGFSLVFSKTGTIIKNITQTKAGEQVTVKLRDGTLKTTVDSIKGEENE